MEFAKNASDRSVLELIFARQEMAYPIVAPPGVPMERVKILRQAFNAVVKDPEYLGDLRRQLYESIPVSGADVAALIDRLYASSPAVIARARTAIEDGKKITTSKSLTPQ